ncbi:hypothetical protein IKF40_02260 [Candidatus Saccharibacteria bacterium]|nr:hypothetical protein [Candidatus Saccharibacteria bacterium]
MFRFSGYDFDQESFLASFRYQGPDGTPFCEKVQFKKTDYDFSKKEILDRALFLAHIIIGTSYYKAHPTPDVSLDAKLDAFQANFFSTIYQEGLSQFAYENNLTRDNLAHFITNNEVTTSTNLDYHQTGGILCGQSGGKDSLLVAKLLTNSGKPWTAIMVSNTENYPKVIDKTGAKNFELIIRKIDTENLKKSAGLNGHVPVTYINMAIMLIQAILNGDNYILTSIGHEGAEPHAYIGDLPINHQWSKTWEAEQLFSEYVHKYISENIHIGSPLRKYSELKIAELFAKNCWADYGHDFSSCNVANYKQGADNRTLSWCSLCAKCANSYLLFAPFLAPEELNLLFDEHKSLFEKPELFDDFKGLLGLDGVMKPFECIGEIAELRAAYHLKKPGFSDLPFDVPVSDFDYQKTYPASENLTALIEQEG